MWRPKDWKPAYTLTLLRDAQSNDLAGYTNAIVMSAYEAGADAILEALRATKSVPLAMGIVFSKPDEEAEK